MIHIFFLHFKILKKLSKFYIFIQTKQKNECKKEHLLLHIPKVGVPFRTEITVYRLKAGLHCLSFLLD